MRRWRKAANRTTDLWIENNCPLARALLSQLPCCTTAFSQSAQQRRTALLLWDLGWVGCGLNWSWLSNGVIDCGAVLAMPTLGLRQESTRCLVRFW